VDTEAALKSIYESTDGGYATPETKDTLFPVGKKEETTLGGKGSILEIKKSCYLDGERR
jgi:hypothetical protein